MARGRQTLEEALAQLARVDATTPDGVEAIRRALDDKRGALVARAARMAESVGGTDLVPCLVRAFNRLLGADKDDPGCRAKVAIIDTLIAIEHDGPAVFRRGMQCVQREPVFGGSVDTAAELRGHSAQGLARTSDPDALFDLVEMLVDPEAAARAGAARAIGDRGRNDGIGVLRLKALTGDKEANVIGECLGALMHLDAGGSLAFVAHQLDNRDEAIAEGAAVALGESRQRAALEVLVKWLESPRSDELLRAGMLAVAMNRSEEAVSYLISRVQNAPLRVGTHALSALRIFRDNDRVRARVGEALARRESDALRAHWEH
jgi:HEAT repeat protein